jgi:GT2 family glycosyltransferase
VKLQSVQPGEAIGAQPGEVVVCIPLYGGHEHFVACLQSVLAHTPAGVRILVSDDASPDGRSAQHIEGLARAAPDRLLYVRQERNVGFPANVNAAFAGAAPADVVVLNSDCVVAAGWLEGLRGAAYADESVATATALSNNGTIVSVPDYCVPSPALPEGWTLKAAAAAVRECSLRLRPALITAVGHCMYVRRSALELVGDFDLEFSPGYGEEVDFSQRCLARGLRHVAADDVLVLHHGGQSFADDGVPNPVQAEHELLLLHRYPYYHDWLRTLQADRSGPLASAIGAARRALRGLRVVIDASRGVREQARSIEAALGATGGADVVTLPAAEPVAGRPTADVVHRLHPLVTERELWSLAGLGQRLVLTPEDPKAHRDPSRFGSFAEWERHRRLATSALALADRVVFASEQARAVALGDGLVEPARASVVAAGQEHELLKVYGATCDAPANPARMRAARLAPEAAPEPMPEAAPEPVPGTDTHTGIARPLRRWLRRRRAARPPL